jgi:predicted AlkP superfamily phosphohydrolase/phosphomutase
MTAKVVALCLDSAEPWVLDHYIAKGRLPNLARLRNQGAYGLTQNEKFYKAEPTYTTVMTGVWPFETGYRGRIVYHADQLDVQEYGTYDFKEYPMFWELGNDFKVCAFDFPQAEIAENVNGVQVDAWGAHTPRRGPGSVPEGLIDDIKATYGPHPTLDHDNNNIYIEKEARQLKEELVIGIERRRQILLDLLARDDWDVLISAFGEVHVVEHQYWHYVFDHPLHEFMAEEGRDDIGDILEQIDSVIGEIEAAAGPDATLVLFAAHGMEANRADLCSGALLAEMLYRWNFNEAALAPRPAGATPPPYSFDYPRHMKYEVWDLVSPEGRKRLTSPRDQLQMDLSLNWQPTNWYKSAWKDMRAFALPSYSDGYIRLSVKGRDKGGLVEPEDYNDVCDELESVVRDWRCARTGRPLVEDILRTRNDALANDPKLPDADIVISWAPAAATDLVEHDKYGQIGPVPFFRLGDHSTNGFLLAKGPGIDPGRSLEEGTTVDFAPTILSRMGAPIPDYMKGRDLLAL